MYVYNDVAYLLIISCNTNVAICVVSTCVCFAMPAEEIFIDKMRPEELEERTSEASPRM